MPHLKLYRRPGKKYRTELRPSRIEILILPLILCFLVSIVVWCYATGHNRPEPETTVPAESCTEGVAEPPAESLPADTEAHPSEV
jgi:hypothetical protein